MCSSILLRHFGSHIDIQEQRGRGLVLNLRGENLHSWAFRHCLKYDDTFERDRGGHDSLGHPVLDIYGSVGSVPL